MLKTIALRFTVALVVAYVLLFATVAAAMLQTPDRFGMFMRYAPAPLVWGALPAERMWLWARGGSLSHGDPAPDFTLPTQDGSSRVTLSSLRGRPVVLVFGSYT
jgi:cytochrome oxidase Cu insertion factor (SCO1/SenC/PrrC family)